MLYLGMAIALLILGLFSLLFFQPRWVLRLILWIAPGALFYGTTGEKAIAITIDDGPDARSTGDILAVLAHYNARATFFLIGDRIPGNEAVVADILAHGHELGNHLMQDHTRSVRLLNPAFLAELKTTEERLLAQLRQHPQAQSQGWPSQIHWFRPGGGFYSAEMIRTASDRGYRCVLGSIFPYDTSIPFSWFATWQILANLEPGAIIVLHDNGPGDAAWGTRTALTLSRVLPVIQRRGYRTVTLSDLMPSDHPGHTPSQDVKPI